MGNLTFGIIKPDAFAAGHSGSIIQRISDAGFKLRAMKTLHMSLKEAEGFYAVHRERPFFGGLTEFMSSNPCIVMVLEKEGAVKAWRAKHK
jgi:nucleoside-diphosphate kinase